jgi:phosphatidylglycerophosphate synthase
MIAALDRREGRMIAVANACTLLRVLLAPLFAWSIIARPGAGALPFVLCLTAVATDFVDGRLARASGWASDARRILDHGADILFLLPGLAMLVHVHRVPAALPWCAAIAFALYTLDGWRRARGREIVLVPSRPGAAAGVANYAVALLATGGPWLGGAALATMAYAAGIAAAALNLAAALDRLQTLVVPRGSVTRV